MITRRSFIKTISQTAVVLTLRNNLNAEDAARVPRIGVLLGTVEKEMEKDPENTLKRIAEMGFKEVEFPRTYGYPVDVFKRIIKKHRLIPLGGGENITNLTNHFADYSAEYNKVGKQYVFCYWPWFDAGLNKTIDDWKIQAEVLNKLGERYKKEGLRLAYHNHNIEFAETEKQIPYNILLQNTHPDLLTFQMDIWWICKSGIDPLEFIRNYPGRFEVCHIKTSGIIAGNEEVSNLNYRLILASASVAGFRHFILENEPGIASPFSYFENSMTLIKNMF